MNFHHLSQEEREKLMILSTLWTTFAGVFLFVVSTIKMYKENDY